MRVVYEDNKKTLHFEKYKVVEEKDNFYGIYVKSIENFLLTHQKTWKRATKIASLLQEAYDSGFSSGYSEGYDESEYERNVNDW